MTDRALVLVDVDNLVTPRRDWPLFDASGALCEDDPSRPHADVTGAVSCATVVVLAFNQSTARRLDGLKVEYLQRLAASLALALGRPGAVGCEPVPVLTAPQTADAALARLLATSPTPAHAGPFREVVLASWDRGLRSVVQASLRHRFPKAKGGAKALFVWRLRDVALPRPFLAASGAGPYEGRPVETARRDLATLSRDLDRQPWLLSQLGLTWRAPGVPRGSVRGVARLARQLTRGPATLDDADRDDGVELAAPTPPGPTALHTVTPSPVGAGAAFAPERGRSLRTRLPVDVLAALLGARALPPRASASRIHDEAVMRDHESPRPAPCHVAVEVEAALFEAHDGRSTLTCTVAREPDEPPPAWWYVRTNGPAYQARAELRLVRAPTADDVPAAAAVTWKGLEAEAAMWGRELLLVAPQVTAVTLERELARGQFGRGETARGKVLVLPLDGDLPARVPLPCCRVQDLDPARLGLLARAGWTVDELQCLPLVIAATSEAALSDPPLAGTSSP